MATYISSLPEDLRTLAIQRRIEQFPNSNEDILSSAFGWGHTPEGGEYWSSIDDIHDELSISSLMEQDDQIIK